MEPLDRIVKTFRDHKVNFVVIGNHGAQLQGAPVLTEDSDIAYQRSKENHVRMLAALEELEAHVDVQGWVAPLPTDDPEIFANADVWHLYTVHGELDLLYAPVGGGYEHLITNAVEVDIGDGTLVFTASMDDIIRSKELANRPKDRVSLPELRRFRDQQLRNREGPGLSFDL